MAIGSAAAFFVAMSSGCGKRTRTLYLLVWEGYAEPSCVHDLEKSHNCKISASYMGSVDELVPKLGGGSASIYGVISSSSDVATTIASSGLATREPDDRQFLRGCPRRYRLLKVNSTIEFPGDRKTPWISQGAHFTVCQGEKG